MKRLFWLPFLLVHLKGTGSTQKSKSCLFQQQEEIWKKIGETAVLNCSFTSNCQAALPFEWFVVKKDSHQRLELTDRYKVNGRSLSISSLKSNDTGLYVCAATTKEDTECCLPFVGEGTPLVVGEKPKVMMWKILVWLLFTLLAIYSLALVMLIIMRKQDFDLTFNKKTSKTETNSLRKKTQFRDVLQELHSRANVNKRKQSTRGNGPQVEAASGNGNTSIDDIYQNV